MKTKMPFLLRRERSVPPLTQDAIPLLMQGKWIADTTQTVSASLMNDMIVVVPRGVSGSVAIAESAVFSLEDFLESYSDLRWTEMP